MRNSYAAYPSSVEDAILVSQIRKAFREESERQKPSNKVLDFLYSYAAAYDTVNTSLMGQVAFMNN